MKKITRKLIIPQNVRFIDIFGPYDQYLKLIRRSFGIKLTIKNNMLRLNGENHETETAYRILERLIDTSQSGNNVSEALVLKFISEAQGHKPDPRKHQSDNHQKPRSSPNALSITPRTEGQKNYLASMQQYDIVFGIGPAGTGKTYLAVAQALTTLKKGVVKKIVLARPAVEAGERLGFLPGDYQAKVNPYLRPLYDALNSFLELQELKKLMEYEVIEVIPLAYMRGRNLDDAFIILDEAQNTTPDQMKMFLTRMGERSKTVVTGDITQIDLPPGKSSGLIEVQSILNRVEGIGFLYLTRVDIVRHRLVQSIVEAYETKSRFLNKKHK